MESNKNELATIANAAANLGLALSESGNTAYCSFVAADEKAKTMLYNGMNNPDERIANEINQIIMVRDVYAETVDIVDEDTGEITQCPRVVLFDANGKSHVAVSVGIVNALKKLFKVFGQPSEWEKPLPLKVKQIGIKKGSMLTLELVNGK
jgi:hypothetical protein